MAGSVHEMGQLRTCCILQHCNDCGLPDARVWYGHRHIQDAVGDVQDCIQAALRGQDVCVRTMTFRQGKL